MSSFASTHQKSITRILLLLIASLCLACAHEEMEGDTVVLTALNSMERIAPHQALFGQNMVNIQAAKNEAESFQVVVHASGKSLIVIGADMSDFTNSTDTIKKENATLFWEEYTRVRLSSPRASLPPGLYADPLVPFIDPETGEAIEPRSQSRETPGGPVVTRGYEMYATPFQVWDGMNQPLWIDIHIPKDASPGEYSGTFTVTLYEGSDGKIPSNDGMMYPGSDVPADTALQTRYEIDVALTVWDFALPDGPTYRNNFGGVRRAANPFGLTPDSPAFAGIEMNYCKMMADHRINPPIPDRLMPDVKANGSLDIDPERTEELKKFIDDLHVTDFPVPPAPFRDVLTSNRGKAIRYYRELYQYLVDHGWDKRAYLYMLDEPNDLQAYEEVLALGALVKEAAPHLKRLVVEQPYKQDPSWPDLDTAVDIWCPLFSFIDSAAVNKKIAGGDEVWSYTALSQRAPSYSAQYEQVKDYDPPYWAIDQPLTAYRMPTWINLQYGISGYLYWTTDYSDRSVTGVMDPWFLPIYAASGKHFAGEGYLIYPGKPCGINGPIASIRLKNVRDGMEDYEYFNILTELAGSDAVKKITSAIVPNWWAKPTAADFQETREAIANEILRLKNTNN